MNLIKQKKKIRRQLKNAMDDFFCRLRRKIHFLRRENRKLIDTAKRAEIKGFWKLIKAITSDKQQPIGSHLQTTINDKTAVTHHENCDMFKSY